MVLISKLKVHGLYGTGFSVCLRTIAQILRCADFQEAPTVRSEILLFLYFDTRQACEHSLLMVAFKNSLRKDNLLSGGRTSLVIRFSRFKWAPPMYVGHARVCV